MKSKRNGKNTSALKIENISKTGFSLFLDNEKYSYNTNRVSERISCT